MIQVKHTKYAICAWDKEKNQGIVYPATVSTNIEDFTLEVKRIVLEGLRDIKFVSLVFDPSFRRNYIPMRHFLNSKDPKCEKVPDGEEKEMYDFLQYDENIAKELYQFFFSHAKKVEYPDGYIEFEFEK